jgi:ABC-2 type transport system permease protein
MKKPYSQWQAMWAIVKASTKAIFKSPQAVFFSLFFPIVLIMIFGALSGSRGITLDVAFDAKADTNNVLYHAIKNTPGLRILKTSEADLLDRLKKGRITAIMNIQKNTQVGSPYTLILHSTTAVQQQDLEVLKTILNSVITKINEATYPAAQSVATISTEIDEARKYKLIDFYLPGMLGFSLIGSAVFGVAFVFYSLRETLVLKRMYSTPVKKGFIVAGESIARILFQLATAVVLILFGKYFYGFTLSNGWMTFIELMILSFLALIVFMGFGFFVSSVAKNQNVIPIYANLFMFPQYFLSGTFFPKSALPAGIQNIISYLPLTALNDAMRKVSFEGLHIWQTGSEILVLVAWGVLTFILAARFFRWES